jgi:hypothetical protein
MTNSSLEANYLSMNLISDDDDIMTVFKAVGYLVYEVLDYFGDD